MGRIFPRMVSERRLARGLVARADALRDGHHYLEAAALYEEALRLVPQRSDLHVQAAHMLKEGGELDRAERHYRAAERTMPDDADLALNLGHFLKVAGRRAEALAAYRRAFALQPGWAEPREELKRLGAPVAASMPAPSVDLAVEAGAKIDAEAALLAASMEFNVQRDLLPRSPETMMHPHREGIEMRRLGRSERTAWGTTRTLRGVESIRGFAISATPLVEVAVFLNGVALHRGPLDGGYELGRELIKRWACG